MFHILLALLFSISAVASERITLFKSDITVQADGVLRVQETIQVHATGNQIRRGIIREFPTKYKDRWGNHVNVQFKVNAVMRDGAREPYHIESASNGKRVFIGSSSRMLDPGYYTFTLNYTTNRQLGFFEKYDELYFNITGNGWRLPIDKAVAVIKLPPEIPRDKITLEAYTGYQGHKDQNFTANIRDDGSLFFETINPLGVFQGITVAVIWPKGFTIPPTTWQSLKFFFTDNPATLIILFLFFLMIIFFVWAYLQNRRQNDLGTVIPLFYPPDQINPGAMRYIYQMKFDAQAVTADIIDLAVAGYITIEKNKSWWGAKYTITKVKTPKSNYFYPLFNRLFLTKNKVTTTDSSSLSKAYKAVEEKYGEEYGALFYAQWGMIAIAFSFLAFSIGTSIYFDAFEKPINFLLLLAMATFAFLASSRLHRYSKEGLMLKREIEGFKLFLKTTEEDRLKVIGTPPTKTPELYEKYLPYAIALGVEKQWSTQFAPLFAKMRQEGNPYVVAWYGGGRFDTFSPTTFSSQITSGISSGLSSAISSSSISPGSFSGSGGRGSSGGGGGGGGGGGW